MREIKFRAWDKENKRFLEDYELSECNLDRDGSIYRPDNSKPFNKYDGEPIFLQYTGLKDKNGKEIYEGDIVTKNCYPYIDEDKQNYVAIVEWCFAGFHTVYKCVNKDKRGISEGINQPLEDVDFEIIGNLFENPELIEGATK